MIYIHFLFFPFSAKFQVKSQAFRLHIVTQEMKKILGDCRRLQEAAEPPVVGCNINVTVGRGDSADQQCSFLMN